MTTTDAHRRLIWPLRLVAVALLVWIPVLGFELKSAGAPRLETVGWQLFDLAELFGLVLTLRLVALRHVHSSRVATSTAGLFFVDAVIDTATSSDAPGSLVTAVMMAVVAELPVAFACLMLARAGRDVATAGPRLLSRQPA